MLLIFNTQNYQNFRHFDLLLETIKNKTQENELFLNPITQEIYEKNFSTQNPSSICLIWKHPQKKICNYSANLDSIFNSTARNSHAKVNYFS